MFKGGGGYILIGVVVGVYLGKCFIYYYDGNVFIIPIRVTARSKALTVFVSSNTGTVGSNPT
jgi:hypothetical protein